MSGSARCVSRARSVVIWSSFLLAMGGWVAAAWQCWVDGYAAGVDPVFITALSVGITFTITCSHAIVMPDKARMYAMGFRDGVAAREELRDDPGPGERPRLELVGR